jgi:mannose-6-phosphate isomerase-like protein (cupin superfamily)
MKINLDEAFSRFTEHWSPRIAAELNGQHVKLAKLQGEFIWHCHADADEMFLVHRGHLVIEFRDGRIELGPGEFLVVPLGVEHRPVAVGEVECVVFEPAGTLNTGNVENDWTVRVPKRL